MDLDVKRELDRLNIKEDYETERHKILLYALDRLDGDRKVYRMVNGALVETTVAEVIIPIENHFYNELLPQSIKLMKKQLAEKYKRFNDYIIRNNLNLPLYRVYPAFSPRIHHVQDPVTAAVIRAVEEEMAAEEAANNKPSVDDMAIDEVVKSEMISAEEANAQAANNQAQPETSGETSEKK